jgi:hypothetical protein
MGWTSENLTPEQQELLDSGLRMLAHMIAETHLRRTALKKMNGKVLPGDTIRRAQYRQDVPTEPINEDEPQSNDE